MKKIARSFVVFILGWQVRRLHRKHNFKIIGVAGSTGKTSTKFAIAAVLQQKYKVRFQEGNYNDIVSVPLVFFGQAIPSLFNPFAWLIVFVKNEICITKPYPFDFVIAELGTDGPGQINEFSKYLSIDIGVLTAIAPEHMEYFKDLSSVADEEIELAGLADRLFVNSDLCSAEYLQRITKKYVTYGTANSALYRLTDIKHKDDGYGFSINKTGQSILKSDSEFFSKMQLFSVCSAVAIGYELGLDKQQLNRGIRSIKPASGRMQKLNGINGSVIIDDTYNASPTAVIEALNTIYSAKALQKIVVLGSMNELGSLSAEAHSEVGRHCDPKQLDMVITIGSDANEYLAAAATKAGCNTKTFDSPYEAGNYLKKIINQDALILAKGSQNGVFAEEAIKQILADPADGLKLVRQTPHWLKLKQKEFNTKGEV